MSNPLSCGNGGRVPCTDCGDGAEPWLGLSAGDKFQPHGSANLIVLRVLPARELLNRYIIECVTRARPKMVREKIQYCRLAALRVHYMTAQAIQAILVLAMAQKNGCHEPGYTDFSRRPIAERENAADSTNTHAS